MVGDDGDNGAAMMMMIVMMVMIVIIRWAMVITERQGQVGRGAATYFHLLQRLPI